MKLKTFIPLTKEADSSWRKSLENTLGVANITAFFYVSINDLLLIIASYQNHKKLKVPCRQFKIKQQLT